MASRRRRSLLMATLALVLAALTGAGATLAQPALAAPSTSTSATHLHPAPISSNADDDCPALYMFGVRGSRNDANDTSDSDFVIDAVHQGLVTKISGVLPVIIDYPAIHVGYAAVSSFGATYIDSVFAGEKTLFKQLKAVFQGCPGTPVILVGYSQGAQVAGDVFEALTRAQQTHVAMVLFGDPEFNPIQAKVDFGNYNARLRGIFQWVDPRDVRQIGTPSIPNVHSYCTQNDPVCNYSKGNLYYCVTHSSTCPHLSYSDRGYTTEAVNWLATRWHYLAA